MFGPPRRPIVRSRAWCVTCFSVERPVLAEGSNVKYYCFQQEKCPGTANLHWQGYCEFDNACTMEQLKLRFGQEAMHCEKRLGTAKQARDYCRKEDTAIAGTFWESGEFAGSQQGKRKDLDIAKERIDEMVATKKQYVEVDIAEEFFCTWAANNKALLRYASLKLQQAGVARTTMCEGLWLYGESGTGKSHQAFEIAERDYPDDWYLVSKDNGWYDMYRGQKLIIFNDFRGEVPLNFLLQMCDKWAFYLPRRGTEPVPCLAEKVIVTSIFHPKDVYMNALAKGESYQQLNRRFTFKELFPADNPEYVAPVAEDDGAVAAPRAFSPRTT